MFRKVIAKHPSMANLSALGLCHLLSHDVAKAKRVFHRITEDYPDSTPGYEWTGVTLWISGEFQKAVEIWERGLDCGYTDEAGGFQIPLFLFFSAIRNPNVYDADQAKTLIKAKLSSRWARNWPAPIGKFVLGLIDRKGLIDEALAIFEVEELEPEQFVQIEFYVGVRELEAKKKQRFLKQMATCAQVDNAEDQCEKALAVFESERGF